MSSSASVYENLAAIKTVGAPGEQKDSNPKLPPNGQFLLEIVFCGLTESDEAGDCQVIEHKVLESSTPLAVVGQVYATTITHMTGEYRDLKQGKFRNFLAAVFKEDENNAQAPWTEMAVYVNDKGAAVGRHVRAETGAVRKSKGKGRPYLHVQFSPA